MNNLVVLDGGLQTTVQDLGRFNHQIDGFPTSGWLDADAAKLANLLVGNQLTAATLEFCLLGGRYLFQAATFIAFAGGQFPLTLNDQPINSDQAIQVKSGDVLTVGAVQHGRYGYLAVAEGVLEPLVMGSRATTTRIRIGGHLGRKLMSGDRIPIGTTQRLTSFAFRKVQKPQWPSTDEVLTIRITKGPQWALFDPKDTELFINNSYQVGPNADRMGYRLAGNPIEMGVANMLSEATPLGGIQISSDGKPIVLLADRQTTGGYPVIGVIISADLHKFVQSQPKQLIKFQLVSLADARAKLLEQHESSQRLAERFEQRRFKAPIGINRGAAQRIQTLFQ